MSPRLPARARPLASLLLTLLVLSGSHAAAQVGLRVIRLAERGVRVDGALGDWREARFSRLGSGGDGSGRFVLGFDAEGLYLAATVRDDRLVHFESPSLQEDAVVLALATPGRRDALTLTELYLQPGVSGRSAARALVRAGRRLQPIRGARVVESSDGHGYTIEAFIPFRALPSRWQEARGAVRIVDVDREAHPDIVHEHASAALDRDHLDRLPNLLPEGGERDVLANFMERAGVAGAATRFALHGQVAGDDSPEQVAVVDRYVVVYGAGYRDGAGFDFAQLPVNSAADVRAAELRDLDADGRSEIVLRLRQANAQGAREIWAVYSSDGSSLARAGAIELRKETAAGNLVNELEVRRGRRRGPPSIRVETARSTMPRGRYAEAPATDAEPILLPWGPVRAVVYEWRDGRFRRSAEEPNPDFAEASATSTTASASQSTPRAAPRPPGIDELVQALRRERRVPAGTRARFERDVNVAEDRTPERIMILGKAMVVVGTHYLGGRSYFHYELPVQSPDDIVSLQTADLTGDRRDELLITVRHHHEGGVTRTLLLVHQLTDEGFPRLLMAEIGRAQGGNSVENEVELRRGQLRIGPGRARGFDATSWPWAPSDGSDGVAPLLLPWTDRPVQYRYHGGRLEAR